MKKPIWKDNTSYSRGEDYSTRVPRSWVIESGNLSLTIHRHIHYSQDVWLASCYEVGVRGHQLRAKEIGEAREEAVHNVMERAQALLADAQNMIGRGVAE